MTIKDSSFNAPDFVVNASPEMLDPTADGSVTVGGYRIDNPAAAWTSKADVLSKEASGVSVEPGVVRKIDEACALFNISENNFTTIDKVASDIVTVTSAGHQASFNIYDNNSLNKAASDLINRRMSLPYDFAHDCAVAIREVSRALNLKLDDDKAVSLRKMAGDYHTDFAAGRKYIEDIAKLADAYNMPKYASELRRVAAVCTDDCDPDMAGMFISAVDTFTRVSGIPKVAAAAEPPENSFYLSNTEFISKQASSSITTANGTVVPANISSKNTENAITKWASAMGYTIHTDSTSEEIAEAVAKMPKAARDEFINTFC